MGWQIVVGTIGGLLAVIGQFFGAEWYLPLIGGVLALLALWIK